MIDIFLGPKRYVQRPGALADAGTELKAFGRRPMILADALVGSILRPWRSWGLTAWRSRFLGKGSAGPAPREAPPTACPSRSTKRDFCAPSGKGRSG